MIAAVGYSRFLCDLTENAVAEAPGQLERLVQTFAAYGFQDVADGVSFERINRVLVISSCKDHGGRIFKGIQVVRGFDAT